MKHDLKSMHNFNLAKTFAIIITRKYPHISQYQEGSSQKGWHTEGQYYARKLVFNRVSLRKTKFSIVNSKIPAPIMLIEVNIHTLQTHIQTLMVMKWLQHIMLGEWMKMHYRGTGTELSRSTCKDDIIQMIMYKYYFV